MSAINSRVLKTLAVTITLLYANAGLAVVISEVELNDTQATAQNVNGSFSLDFDANIGDALVNTSTTIPHVSIVNDINTAGFDFFEFLGGGTIILDIDFGSGGVGSQDYEIGIWNSLGILVEANDDRSSSVGAGGSTSSLDSFIDLAGEPIDTYTVGVCEFSCSFFNGFLMTGGAQNIGDTYTLQISSSNATVSPTVPEPMSATLLGLGLLGLGLARARKRN